MDTIKKTVEAWHLLVDNAHQALRLEELESAECMFLEAYSTGIFLFGKENGSIGVVLLRLAEIYTRTGRLELAHQYESEADRIISTYLD